MSGISCFGNSSLGTGCLKEFQVLKPKNAAANPIPTTTVESKILHFIETHFTPAGLLRGSITAEPVNYLRRDRTWRKCLVNAASIGKVKYCGPSLPVCS